jgi:hypothetical protein
VGLFVCAYATNPLDATPATTHHGRQPGRREVKPVTIDIIVDGQLFGRKARLNVPRAGDVIQLREGKLHVEVRRVVWADAGDDSDIYDYWVQLLCETVNDIKAT